MNMLLVCELWMLLSLSTANAIWCYECNKPIPRGSCPEIHEFCWAGERSGCYTKKLYIGGSMIKFEVGCLQTCFSKITEHEALREEFACCFTDYCNE